jgi:hypothetical protein
MSIEPRRIKKIVRASVPRTTEEIAGTHSSEDLQRFAKSSLRLVREAAKKELKQRAETSLPERTRSEIANAARDAANARHEKHRAEKSQVGKRAYRTRKVSEGHVYALTKPRAIEGYVTLTQLASERGIQPQLARIWMKKNGWVASAEGWMFKTNSRELKKARKVLGLPPS